ncbi:MAG TPA: O-antigen ligase family protein, partial [Dongiaceae bacterium]|nr:O-antigen ligase family protein [Dongiaceae bacterium]
ASGHPLGARGWGRQGVLITFPVTAWWLRDRAQATRLAWLVAVAGAVVGAYAVLQHFTGADWYRTLLGRRRAIHLRGPGDAGFASVGFFRSYLTFGHVMLFPFAWALAAALHGHRSAGPMAVASALGIVFSTARGAWVAAAAVAATMVLLTRRRSALVTVVAVGAIGAVALASNPSLREHAAHMFDLGGVNAGRMAIYRANLDIVHDHPWLGLGFGRYAHAARRYYAAHPEADRRSHAHNNYLHMAAEAGLIGLAAFVLVFARALAEGIPRPGPDRWVQAGAWAALVGFLVGGLTQYNFDDHEVTVAMWFTTAILLQGRGAGASGDSRVAKPSKLV